MKSVNSVKLTLMIDKSVIDEAKKYAKRTKKSVSRMVEDFLRGLMIKHGYLQKTEDLEAPKTEKIAGMFVDTGKSYKELLEEALEERFPG